MNTEDLVLAAHVRSCDPPQFVAETIEDLLAMVGQDWAGEQCDNCGNSRYIIRLDPKFELDKVKSLQIATAFYVECVPETELWKSQGLEIPEGVGCGTQYRLRWYEENEVQF